MTRGGQGDEEADVETIPLNELNFKFAERDVLQACSWFHLGVAAYLCYFSLFMGTPTTMVIIWGWWHQKQFGRWLAAISFGAALTTSPTTP